MELEVQNIFKSTHPRYLKIHGKCIFWKDCMDFKFFVIKLTFNSILHKLFEAHQYSPPLTDLSWPSCHPETCLEHTHKFRVQGCSWNPLPYVKSKASAWSLHPGFLTTKEDENKQVNWKHRSWLVGAFSGTGHPSLSCVSLQRIYLFLCSFFLALSWELTVHKAPFFPRSSSVLIRWSQNHDERPRKEDAPVSRCYKLGSKESSFS